jgi:hypothetical protein
MVGAQLGNHNFRLGSQNLGRADTGKVTIIFVFGWSKVFSFRLAWHVYRLWRIQHVDGLYIYIYIYIPVIRRVIFQATAGTPGVVTSAVAPEAAG